MMIETSRLIFFQDEKYPGGIRKQKEKLEAEGHTIVQKGRKNIRYYVKDCEDFLETMM